MTLMISSGLMISNASCSGLSCLPLTTKERVFASNPSCRLTRSITCRTLMPLSSSSTWITRPVVSFTFSSRYIKLLYYQPITILPITILYFINKTINKSPNNYTHKLSLTKPTNVNLLFYSKSLKFVYI
jgi:hypothetical protein